MLVTGGASFIGSHLTEELLSEGAKITIVDDLSSGEMENIAHFLGDLTFVEGDLRDSRVANEACRGQ